MAKVFVLLLLSVAYTSAPDPNPVINTASHSTRHMKAPACCNAFAVDNSELMHMKKAKIALFSDSLSYLYTSYHYADQGRERQGLAKGLRKMSDERWENGMAFIKKLLERGGKIVSMDGITGKGLNKLMGNDCTGLKEYRDTLHTSLALVKDECGRLNDLHSKAIHKKDGEFARFFADEMHECTEKVRELEGLHNNLKVHMDSGVALDIFDTNLESE